MRALIPLVALFLGVVQILGCGETNEAEDRPGGEAQRLVVATSFYPTTYFTRRIAGDLVDVASPLPEGEDPIFWQPSDAALETFRTADLVVLNGASFEKWADDVALPESRVVDTAHGFEDRFLTFEDATTHSHGPQGEHSHHGTDGHTWMDPTLAKEQAAAIRDALVRLRPERKDELDAGYRALADDLDDLDRRFAAVAEEAEGRKLFASHPAYDYLARRHGFELVNLDLDPESAMTDEQVAAIREKNPDGAIAAIIWESRPKEGIAARLSSELGLDSFVVSPCETLPDEAREAGRDYLDVMRANVEELRKAYAAD